MISKSGGPVARAFVEHFELQAVGGKSHGRGSGAGDWAGCASLMMGR